MFFLSFFLLSFGHAVSHEKSHPRDGSRDHVGYFQSDKLFSSLTLTETCPKPSIDQNPHIIDNPPYIYSTCPSRVLDRPVDLTFFFLAACLKFWNLAPSII